jgi:hypothetical protein
MQTRKLRAAGPDEGSHNLMAVNAYERGGLAYSASGAAEARARTKFGRC